MGGKGDLQKGGRAMDLPLLPWHLYALSQIASWAFMGVVLAVCLPYYKLTKAGWVGRLLGIKEAPADTENGAEQALLDSSKPTLLCIGDSITEGAMSADWVGQLQNLYPALRFINCGVGGEVSEATANRIDDVLEAYPGFAAATLLIGTNDINARSFRQVAGYYNQRNNLKDGEYSLEAYTGNVERVLQTLRRRGPKAAIAVFTIPPLGEDLDSNTNALVELYNERLKSIAAANKTTVLDLNAACVEAIVAVRGIDGKKRPAPPFQRALVMFNIIALLLIKLVTGSLDKGASIMGRVVMVDDIHLSDRGGAILLGLLRPFIEKTLVPED